MLRSITTTSGRELARPARRPPRPSPPRRPRRCRRRREHRREPSRNTGWSSAISTRIGASLTRPPAAGTARTTRAAPGRAARPCRRRPAPRRARASSPARRPARRRRACRAPSSATSSSSAPFERDRARGSRARRRGARRWSSPRARSGRRPPRPRPAAAAAAPAPSTLDQAAAVRQARGRACSRSADQAELVERGRAQLVDQPPDARRSRPRVSSRSSPSSSATGGGRRPAVAARRRAAARSPASVRAEPVVQVAPQPPPLLLAGRHQPLARALQLGGQARRACAATPAWPARSLEQRAVGAARAASPRRPCTTSRADRLAR